MRLNVLRKWRKKKMINNLDRVFYIKYNGNVTECKIEKFIFKLGSIVMTDISFDISKAFKRIEIRVANNVLLAYNDIGSNVADFTIYENPYDCEYNLKKNALIHYNSRRNELTYIDAFNRYFTLKSYPFYTQLFEWIDNRFCLLRWLTPSRKKALSFTYNGSKCVLTDRLTKNTTYDWCSDVMDFDKSADTRYYGNTMSCAKDKFIKLQTEGINISRFCEYCN